MASVLWQVLIERLVSGARRDPSAGAASPSAPAPGLITFSPRDLVTYLVASGCRPTRAEAAALCEALRARDIIRPPRSIDARFTDGAAGRWACRHDEAPSPECSFSVAALMARSEYVLCAPLFKQGALFLNARFFLLERAECRLYVYNSDCAALPRYYVDFRKCADGGAPCAVALLAPGGGGGGLEKDWTTDDSDTEAEEGGQQAAGGGAGAAAAAAAGAAGARPSPWLPRGTGASSLPVAKAAAWGFQITGPALRIIAYASSQRRAVVWVRALRAAAACKPARPFLSHSQMRLKRGARVDPPQGDAAGPVDAEWLLAKSQYETEARRGGGEGEIGRAHV